MRMLSFGPLSKKLVIGRHISGGSRKSLSSVKYSQWYGMMPNRCTETDVMAIAVVKVLAIGGAAQ
jgi:hypothetical protein